MIASTLAPTTFSPDHDTTRPGASPIVWGAYAMAIRQTKQATRSGVYRLNRHNAMALNREYDISDDIVRDVACRVASVANAKGIVPTIGYHIRKADMANNKATEYWETTHHYRIVDADGTPIGDGWRDCSREVYDDMTSGERIPNRDNANRFRYDGRLVEVMEYRKSVRVFGESDHVDDAYTTETGDAACNAAMETLSADERLALRLYATTGSIAVIARALGVTIPSAANTIRRVIATLQQATGQRDATNKGVRLSKRSGGRFRQGSSVQNCHGNTNKGETID